ncbi:MAG: DNA-directed RNA polymerase specialized sigma24 family protein [Myxococcota bacterium]|jgi:DNA-directed RNA polymerase specialized sigma24 family protein
MTDDQSRQRLDKALAGNAAAVRQLINVLTPVIHARTARVLLRRQGVARGRDVRQEIEDMTQDVFVSVFADAGKKLRAWDPARGMGLKSFVGMIAEQHVAQMLRSRRRSPWTEDPTEAQDFDAVAPAGVDAEKRLVTRQLVHQTMDDVRGDLSPKGLQLFDLLLVAERNVDSVCRLMQMKPDAVYAWRSRLGKQLKSAWHRITAHEEAS